MAGLLRPWVVGSVLALLAGGCVPGVAFLVQGTNPAGGQQVVAGRLEVVSATVQASLGKMGLFVQITREGEAIHLKGKTRTGKPFVIILQRVMDEGSEQTRIRVEWEEEADQAFWIEFLGLVTRPAGKTQAGKPPGFKGTPGT
jgi:hypothetical protein